MHHYLHCNQLRTPLQHMSHMFLWFRNCCTLYMHCCHWYRRHHQYIYHYMFGYMFGLSLWHSVWLLFRLDMLMCLLYLCQIVWLWYYLPLNMAYKYRCCWYNNIRNYTMQPYMYYQNYRNNVYPPIVRKQPPSHQTQHNHDNNNCNHGCRHHCMDTRRHLGNYTLDMMLFHSHNNCHWQSMN